MTSSLYFTHLQLYFGINREFRYNFTIMIKINFIDLSDVKYFEVSKSVFFFFILYYKKLHFSKKNILVLNFKKKSSRYLNFNAGTVIFFGQISAQ